MLLNKITMSKKNQKIQIFTQGQDRKYEVGLKILSLRFFYQTFISSRILKTMSYDFQDIRYQTYHFSSTVRQLRCATVN